MDLNFTEVKHIFSANEIRQYSECARKRYYSSRDCLALKPVATNGNLILGKRVHEMLDYYYTEGNKRTQEDISFDLLKALEAGEFAPFSRVESFEEELGANLGVFNCLEKLYLTRLSEDLKKYEILGTEVEFTLNDWPIKGVQYHGQIDMIARDREKNCIVFFEHKTSKDFRPEIYNRFDIQLHIYSAYGVLYSQMQELPWGGMVLNELKKAKTERGYADHRMYYLYSDKEMSDFEQWIAKKTAAAISSDNHHEPCNNYMTCKMCDYAPICLAYGYVVPEDREAIIEQITEENAPLYAYNPRESETEEEG